MLALSVYRKGDLDLRIQIIFVTALETRRTQFGHIHIHMTGPSSLGVPGMPRHTQILEDQLTLFQPGGTDYAHTLTTGTARFSDLPTALNYVLNSSFFLNWCNANPD